MKKTILSILGTVGLISSSYGQQHVDSPSNFGFRLWGSDHYKISLGYNGDGTGAGYYYGPVQNWAIKTSMYPTSRPRGWVWGVSTPGVAPVVAMGINGDMQIKGTFIAEGKMNIGNQNLSSKNNYDLNILNTNGKIAFGDNNAIGNSSGGINCFIGEWGTGGTDTDISQLHGKKGLKFTIGNYQNGEREAMIIGSNGNIGIGTTAITHNFKLSVGGNMRATEIEVSASGGWADFVFEKDYNLQPLSEVEKFISENNHLPNVPSEEEVLEQGINLGEMDAILLRKIEELTLHIIEQEKRIKELEKTKNQINN